MWQARWKKRLVRQSGLVRRPALNLENLEERSLPSFFGPQDFRTEPFPSSAVLGDVNGDGIPDLVSVSQQGNPTAPGDLSISLGNGDGTFQPALKTPVSFSPFAVAVGDFNGDGKLDVVVTDSGFREGNTVSVLLGNGDGTFQSPRAFAVGRNPKAVAVGDVNGDGIPDVVTANFFDGTVSVLLGTGDGSFRNGGTYAVGVNPHAIALGDFEGDGRLDIVTANEGFTDILGDVSVLRNNGDGTFQPAVHYGIGSGERNLAAEWVGVGDFNGDGNIDIVTANVSDVGGSISVLLNNGDGTFAAARRATNTPSATLAVGDVNGDGVLDLVTTDTRLTGSNPNFVTVLLGNGDGTFRPPIRSTEGVLQVQAVGDVNGDGKLDVAVLVGGNSVAALLGNGDGTFLTAPAFATGPSPSAVATADLNGDGIPDLVTANRGGNSVSVLTGNGDGTFQPARDFPAGNQPLRVAVGDFNGDGIPDLLVLNRGVAPAFQGTLSLLVGNGDGTFQAPRTIIFQSASAFPVDLAVADFNGDGKLDVAITDIIVTTQGDFDQIDLLLGNGDGTFRPLRPISLAIGANARGLAVADFNGDGIPDIAVATRTAVKVFFGVGDGSFGAGLDIPDGNQPEALAVGDFNGDGSLDLAVTHTLPDHDFLSIFLGNGRGVFQAAGDFPTGQFSNSIAVGDFNGDGIPDLVTGNAANSDVSVLLGVGDGTFQPATNYITGTGPGGVAVGDFNGDGAPDIAVADSAANRVSILINLNDWSTSPHPGGARTRPTAAPLARRPLVADTRLSELGGSLAASSGRTESITRPDEAPGLRLPEVTDLDPLLSALVAEAGRDRRAAQPAAPPLPVGTPKVRWASEEPLETAWLLGLAAITG